MEFISACKAKRSNWRFLEGSLKKLSNWQVALAKRLHIVIWSNIIQPIRILNFLRLDENEDSHEEGYFTGS